MSKTEMDIVERLRNSRPWFGRLVVEAADLIERQRKALAPFAQYAVEIRPECLDHEICGPSFRVGDIREAAAASTASGRGGVSKTEPKLTAAQQRILSGLSDEWRMEDADWRAGVVFLRMAEDMNPPLCEMKLAAPPGRHCDVRSGPGVSVRDYWWTRRTNAGRTTLSDTPLRSPQTR